MIIAAGTSPRMLGIPGEKELSGKGMTMNAARDCDTYAGKHVYVVGGSDGAVKEALYLSKSASQVTIIHFEDGLGLNSRLHGVYGTERVEALEIADERTGAIETIEDPGCGIFVYAGTVPNTELYGQLKLENGFIPVNERMETEIPGVYAAGDIRVKGVRQVSTAVADGTIAAVYAAMN